MTAPRTDGQAIVQTLSAIGKHEDAVIGLRSKACQASMRWTNFVAESSYIDVSTWAEKMYSSQYFSH